VPKRDSAQDELIPFMLQTSQLDTYLARWAKEMRLDEKKLARIHHISLGDDLDGHEDCPAIHATIDDSPCPLCDLPGHNEISCHKFINNVGENMMKASTKDSAHITEMYKNCVRTGTHNPGCTPRRTTHSVCVIGRESPAPGGAHIPAIVPDSNDCRVHGPSFKKKSTLQITRILADYEASYSSAESDDDLAFTPIVKLMDCDVGLGVYYDEVLLDHINAH
jgi:hypothetical protein